MNHSSWWDGYMIGVVNQTILRHRFKAYIMMEEQQLRSYRFFTCSGAFSIHRQDRREAATSVAYISRILNERANRALYMFPQGEIVPNDRRPLLTFTGLAHVAKRVEHAILCPVGVRYEFRGEQRPEIFIRLGPIHRASTPVDVHTLTRDITQRLTTSVDALRNAVVADDVSGFSTLLRGRPGINRVLDAFLR
jgi:1-acyl-sn-glycerol-3-phosphate acyltransferase